MEQRWNSKMWDRSRRYKEITVFKIDEKRVERREKRDEPKPTPKVPTHLMPIDSIFNRATTVFALKVLQYDSNSI